MSPVARVLQVDLSRTIARPTAELAGSSALGTLTAPPPQAAVAASAPIARGGALQLVQKTQVRPPPKSRVPHFIISHNFIC